MYLPLDSLASQSAQQEKEREQMMTVGGGLKLAERIGNAGQIALFLKTFLACSQFWNQAVLLKWKEKRLGYFVMTRNTKQTQPLSEFSSELLPESFRKLSKMDTYFPGQKKAHQSFCVFQLAPLERRTDGTGYGLLHTPRSLMIEETPERFQERMGDRNGTTFPNLAVQMNYLERLLPTPTVADGEGGRTTKGKSRQEEGGLKKQIKLLPTINASEWKVASFSPSRIEKRQSLVGGMMRGGMLPTPTNSTATFQGMEQARFHSTKRPTYQDAALIPTPTAQDAKSATMPQSQALRDSVPGTLIQNGMSIGYKLQPEFVEWMMGFPEGWTELDEYPANPRTKKVREDRTG